MSKVVCKVDCIYNDGKDSCMNAEVIIKPFTMPDEEGKGEYVIGFVCGIGTEALYGEMNNDEDSQ